MKNVNNNKYIALFSVIGVLLVVLMFFYTPKRERVTFGEDILNNIIMPFEKMFMSAQKSVNSMLFYTGDITAVREQNKELQNTIDTLNRKIKAIEEYRTENERLRSLLELKQNQIDYETVAAAVISTDSGMWFRTFKIDKGSVNGIKINDAVMTSKGLVGVICEVGINYAVVQSILDINSAVGTVVERTGDVAIMEGDVDLQENGYCKMTCISKNSNIIVGDIVTTSGLGGIYPKSIPIGTVKEIHPDTQGVSQYAVIEPYTDFSKITEVLILK